MQRTLKEAFEEAERAFAAQRWADALRGYVAVIRAAPRFTRARYRVADALLNAGDPERAKAVYKSLAWHYIRSGHPLSGLVVCKMVVALDPGYEDLLYILAELYSSESERVGDVPLPTSVSLPDGALAPDGPDLDPPTLMATAAELAADTGGIDQSPARLPRIPLFSQLSEDAFLRVLSSLRLRRVTHGEAIVREGEPGESFFMVADGVVTVFRRIDDRPTLLARLYQGAIFGEMALVARQPRSASVIAEGDVDLLEVSRLDLEGHAAELDSVKQALTRFTRGRLLANLAATSPLFRHLSKPERRGLIAEFRTRRVGTGDIVIEEGEPGHGLYLPLSGRFEVRTAGTLLATLGPGDVFGEISLLRDTPTTASVTALTSGEVLVLNKMAFRDVIARHPEVRAVLISMSDDRLRVRSQATGDIVVEDAMILM